MNQAYLKPAKTINFEGSQKMRLFDKMPAALAMLGSLDILKQIDETETFDTYGIRLVLKDYVTTEELIAGIAENENAEYVLISDSALIGQKNGKYDVIKEIRKHYPDIFIAMFMAHERFDKEYENWADGYKVYRIYYADSSGEFDFANIVPDMLSIRNGLLAKQSVLPEEIMEHQIQVDEHQNHVFVNDDSDSVTIAALSISSGAGSTYTAVGIAENLARQGYTAALIAFDGKTDLLYANKGHADYIVPAKGQRERQASLRETLAGDYDFIVLDFGRLLLHSFCYLKALDKKKPIVL
jgi:uncharacterized phage-like protein YoqJ